MKPTFNSPAVPLYSQANESLFKCNGKTINSHEFVLMEICSVQHSILTQSFGWIYSRDTLIGGRTARIVIKKKENFIFT